MKLARWIYNHLGTDFGGTPSPPMTNLEIFWEAAQWEPTATPLDEDEYYVARIGNDGFELQLGSGDNWNLFMPMKAARRLSLWLLWIWVRWEWFGLRRVLWYWALHKIVSQVPTTPGGESDGE